MISRLPLTVDIAAMAHSRDAHEQYLIVNLVHHAIVANANAVQICVAL